MAGFNQDDSFNNKGYRIRCMRSLIEQIKNDYAECNRLWEKLENGSMEIADEEELLRVMSWLRQELNVFSEMKQTGIEGISSAEIEEIEKDIRKKETNIRVINTNKLRKGYIFSKKRN